MTSPATPAASRSTRSATAVADASRGILARVGGLEVWLHVTLVLLVVASTVRYLSAHGFGDRAAVVLTGAAVLLLVDASHLWVPWRSRGWWPTVGFAVLAVAWLVLVLLAPSFAWCAVPLAFVALRVLRFGVACAVVAAMVLAVALAWTGMRQLADPTVLVGPACVAVLAVVAYRALDADARLRQRLLDDLRATQGDLAEAQHRAGTLAERARLSREIHDSVAQGLSSINLLLQAADQQWDQRPETARTLVDQAARSARDGLDEARRLVRDLAPTGLPAEAVTLPLALADLVRQAGGPTGTQVDLRVHGEPVPLPDDVAVGLLRTARGALANAAEHAGADRVTVTLTFQGSAVSLDVRDDGRGFDPDDVPPPGDGVRGHGLPGLRTRVRALGGQLVVESAPGEGTTVAASVPLPEDGRRDPA